MRLRPTYTHLFNGSHDDAMDALDAAAQRGAASLTPIRAIGG